MRRAECEEDGLNMEFLLSDDIFKSKYIYWNVLSWATTSTRKIEMQISEMLSHCPHQFVYLFVFSFRFEWIYLFCSDFNRSQFQWDISIKFFDLFRFSWTSNPAMVLDLFSIKRTFSVPRIEQEKWMIDTEINQAKWFLRSKTREREKTEKKKTNYKTWGVTFFFISSSFKKKENYFAVSRE